MVENSSIHANSVGAMLQLLTRQCACLCIVPAYNMFVCACAKLLCVPPGNKRSLHTDLQAV
jgi:hypothetical protein